MERAFYWLFARYRRRYLVVLAAIGYGLASFFTVLTVITANLYGLYGIRADGLVLAVASVCTLLATYAGLWVVGRSRLQPIRHWLTSGGDFAAAWRATSELPRFGGLAVVLLDTPLQWAFTVPVITHRARGSWSTFLLAGLAIQMVLVITGVLVSIGFRIAIRPILETAIAEADGEELSLPRTWSIRAQLMLLTAVLIMAIGTIIGSVTPHVHTPAHRIGVAMVASILLGLIATATWWVFGVSSATRPVADLTAATKRIAISDFGTAVPIVSSDEFGQLARSMNAMQRGLQERDRLRKENEALSRLRRFLAPQIAEAVLNAGDAAVLQPHRRQIAVFFCDLRGFTSFASGAEPEEVVEALDHYYGVVGGVLRDYQATLGHFAGDGIMAYLNDPLPCENPPRTAVEMALALQQPMTQFLETWRRRGFDLGYGVGVAYGYATLGTIGLEERSDYTALGSVVNLAARLCSEAASGEVLIDGRTADTLDGAFSLTQRTIVLKGIPDPVRAHLVAGPTGNVPR